MDWEENEKADGQGIRMEGTGEQGEIPREEFERLLQHLLAWKRQNGSRLKELFPKDFAFPPARSLQANQLRARLKSILEILSKNGIAVELKADVPEVLMYDYLLRELSCEKHWMRQGVESFRLTGCDWNCPDCFQLDYCLVRSIGS